MALDTINSDVSDIDGLDAFLTNLGGEERKPAPSTETEDDEAPQPEHDEPEVDVETPAGGDEETEIDPDDTEVDIKVGEETKKAKLRDLKRLYGQEASLTQKSQALAEERTRADATFQKADTALKAMVGRAQEVYKNYADIDWFVAAQQMDTTNFQLLRQEAAAAKADVDFFETELTGLQQQHQEHARAAYQKAASECIKVLEHPDTGIKGFGQPLYAEMLTFADKSGLGPVARQATNPAVLKLLHMAMQWDRQQSATQVAEKKIAAAPNKPTTTLKPGAVRPTGGKAAQALKALRQSGSQDDAADAFLASFSR